MWCKHCREDVPGYAVTTGGPVSCARCGTALLGAIEDASIAQGVNKTAAHGIELEHAPVEAPVELNDWEFDDDFLSAYMPSAIASAQLRTHRIDSGGRIGSAHAPPASRQVRKQRRHSVARTSKISALAWIVLALSLMSFVCGAVLMAWSVLSGRSELWNLGLPICAGGQIGLIVGLVLQLERVWQNSHLAADKLEQVDQQLHELQRSNALLHATNGSAAQAFYAHMAEGASPQLLLADLKGQLDLLAIRMAEQSRKSL